MTDAWTKLTRRLGLPRAALRRNRYRIVYVNARSMVYRVPWKADR